MIKYNKLNELNLPKYLIKEDTVIEVPFEYGYINFYPYYEEGEIVLDFDKISKLEKLLFTNETITSKATEALDELTLDSIYDYIFQTQKEISKKFLKYEFEDVYYKLINFAKEKGFKFGIANLGDDLYIKIVLNEIEFKSPNFFIGLSLNENNEVEFINYYRAQKHLSYKDIQDYKNFIIENLDKISKIEDIE